MAHPPISLAYLTYAPTPAPEAIRLAGKLGYDAVGLRTLPVAPGGAFDRLIEEPALLRQTRAAMKDAGIVVFDVEIVRLAADFDARRLKPFFETCAALSAKAVLIAGDDPDENRLAASLAAFCEAAAPYGLTGDLEFMPWTKVPNAAAARRIVEKAAQPNARVLVDALHFARSKTSLADIAALPAGMLSYAQICDAPAEIPTTDAGLIHTAREARLLPGEGGVDLVGLFAQLPQSLPVSVEIPHIERVKAMGVEAWAAAALKATKAVLAERDAAVARGETLRKTS